MVKRISRQDAYVNDARQSFNIKSILIWFFGIFIALDFLIVGLALAFPAYALGVVDAVSFETNSLGHQTTQTMYTHMTQKKLSSQQRQTTSFSDNSYIQNFNDVTKYMGQTKGLYLQGYVAAPDVSIYQPIYYGTSNQVLANGAGTAKDNQVMGIGNYAISGHNMGQYATWKVPVPDTSGALISPGTHFSLLEKKQPKVVYLTDGVNVFTYKTVSRFVTNMGNGYVIDDSFPYYDQHYSYTKLNANGSSTGQTESIDGLGLGEQNNTKQNVLTSSVNDALKTPVDHIREDHHEYDVYELHYKTNYRYANALTKAQFKIQFKNAGVRIEKSIRPQIESVQYENGQVSVRFYLKGSIGNLKSTIGNQLVLYQLQNNAFVTLTTCATGGQGDVANRIVVIGQLSKQTKLVNASDNVKKLFPDLVKMKTKQVHVNQTKDVVSLSKRHVTGLQRGLQHIVSGIMWQVNLVKKV